MPSTSNDDTTMPADTADDPLADFREATRRIEDLRASLADADIDREELRTVAEAYRSVETVLDRWEERATDWDDFQGYVEFRDDLADTLESIPEDVPEQEAFLEADSRVKTGGVTKSLKSGDFEAAREALAAPREYAELHAALESALDARRNARNRVERELEDRLSRLDALERLRELGDADLDAPIDRLREPIAAYNAEIATAFREFRRDAPAEAFLAFVRDAAETPFVEYESPPADLLEFVDSPDAEAYTVDELLEYAEYSSSKLSHYVDDPDRLQRRIATNRTYLERLSAAPLQIEWPPRTADELRFRIAELLSLVGRIADEATVATLRKIRERTRSEEYGRLRRAAHADVELTDDERRRLERGDVETELSAVRKNVERLETALSDLDG